MTKTPSSSAVTGASLFLRLLYRSALAAMPTGFAVWLVGMSLNSYSVSVLGLLLLIAGGFYWQDDQHPAHPGN